MAQSKRPTSLKIGWMDFEVRYLDDEEWTAEPSLSEGDGGQCDGAIAVISIRLAEHQHDIHVKEILLHEVMHACFYACGITVNEDLRTVPDIEEHVVFRTAPFMLGVLRDNPDLAAFLTEK